MNIEEKIEIKKGILDHLIRREKSLKTLLNEVIWERSAVEFDIEMLEKKSK